MILSLPHFIMQPYKKNVTFAQHFHFFSTETAERGKMALFWKKPRQIKTSDKKMFNCPHYNWPHIFWSNPKNYLSTSTDLLWIKMSETLNTIFFLQVGLIDILYKFYLYPPWKSVIWIVIPTKKKITPVCTHKYPWT